ncbi:multidrug resistance protein [Desulfotignum phosphitoxidans DSM 13687]|uniref:Multidrug resistance protein n=2 Tax=Desulfotignum phosphitoxidans TaxID=190898 RepID=S0FW55_9BACT|nr:multidrug resistance protein [Desulfotignum phosphitoxidans DSM 13687]
MLGIAIFIYTLIKYIIDQFEYLMITVSSENF